MRQEQCKNNSTIGVLTISDVARELRISPSTARRIIVDGDLVSLRFGKKSRRVLRSDLEVYITKSRQGVRDGQ